MDLLKLQISVYFKIKFSKKDIGRQPIFALQFIDYDRFDTAKTISGTLLFIFFN